MYSTTITTTLHRMVTVDGLSIFYREAGDQSNPDMKSLAPGISAFLTRRKFKEFRPG